jgi:membrane protease YdiL (CAAX protease family)
LLIAAVKLALLAPLVVASLVLCASILNLHYDGAASDRPGFLNRLSLRLHGSFLLIALLALIFVPKLVRAFDPDGAGLTEAHPRSLLPFLVAFLAANFLLAISSRKTESLSYPANAQAAPAGTAAAADPHSPFAARSSDFRQPAFAFVLSLPALVLVASFNRILVEDVFGYQLPRQLMTGLSDLSGSSLWLSGAMLVLLFPFLEELLFRKYLWGALADRADFGVARATMFSAIAFAAFHPPTIWLPILTLGCLLGWVRWRSGRLADAIVIHQLYNLMILALFLGPAL